MGGAVPWQKKAMAYCGLVFIQCAISLIYRLSQTDKRSFSFNPASAVTMAEVCKFCISCNFMVASHGGVASAIAAAKEQVNMAQAGSIGILAALYCFNNNLQFVINTMADPGSILLVKNSSTFVSAIFLVIFVGRHLTSHQWVAILLQIAGLVITQWNACADGATLSLLAYGLMFTSAMVTATTQVWNENMLKVYKMDMHVQNATLYLWGATFNLFVFFFISSPAVKPGIGFFEGYDTWSAVGVVVANSMIGLAITAVYKYCDVMMKTFATANTTVIMVTLSTVLFSVPMSLTAAVGVFVVIAATYLYITSAAPASAKDVEGKTKVPAAALSRKSKRLVVGGMVSAVIVVGWVVSMMRPAAAVAGVHVTSGKV